MTEALRDDMITVPIFSDKGRNIGMHKICRWAYVPVNQRCVSAYFSRKEQDFQVHKFAHCFNAIGRKFVPSEDYKEHPMIGVRTYANPETALTNSIYYHKYGEHRCNLACDSSLGAGVYAYTDLEIIVDNLCGTEPCKADTVIGVVAGYLHKSQKKKGIRVSLDPRSSKLLGFWTQIHGLSGFHAILEKKTRFH